MKPMSDYHINIFYSNADRGYIADIPDLEACSAFGKSPSEALEQVQIAKRTWLEAAHAAGKPIPRAALSSGDVSGRLAIESQIPPGEAGGLVSVTASKAAVLLE